MDTRVEPTGTEVLTRAADATTSAGPATLAGRQRSLPHLFQLRAGGHLLREQRGLDAVEQPLQPADQLGLGDPQFRVGRCGVLGERQGQPLELVTQLRGQTALELADRRLMDLLEPVAARVVEGSGAYLLEELLDHRADPHRLRGLFDHVAQSAGLLVGVGRSTRTHHDDAVVVCAATAWVDTSDRLAIGRGSECSRCHGFHCATWHRPWCTRAPLTWD